MIDLEIPKGIDNIIFDLGGVILNIDYNLTAQAFKDLGAENFDEMYSQQKQFGLFDQLETGQISQQGFINEMLRLLPSETKPKQVIDAWNAMLLDLPKERLKKLEELKNNYSLFLLSNTNSIHFEAFTKIIQKQHNLSSFQPYFEKLYYSHEIGLRKPNKEVFEHILDEQKLKAESTLFVDDSIQHVEGAKKAGLNAVLFKA